MFFIIFEKDSEILKKKDFEKIDTFFSILFLANVSERNFFNLSFFSQIDIGLNYRS